MTIPIASPQNVIALSALRTVSQDHRTVSFIEWLLLACPTVVLAIFVVYFVLKRKFGRINFGYSSPSVESGDCPEPDKERAWSVQQYVVIALMTVTVTGWCLFETVGLDRIFGHMGIFGLVAVACMHAFGLLGVEDLQSLPWSVLVLLGGGICLGTAVEKSGLLSFVAQEISLILSGFSVWLVFFILLSGIAVIANFLSSTVCGLIVFPIIAKVGMAQSHPKLFVVSAALMTSGAMALPVSSFPNANCAAVSDLGDKHKPILATSDYIKTGFAVGFSILALLVSAGFVWGTIVIDIN
jgi:phosphate transporter